MSVIILLKSLSRQTATASVNGTGAQRNKRNDGLELPSAKLGPIPIISDLFYIYFGGGF